MRQRGPEGRDTRRPCRLDHVAEVAGVPWEEVKAVADVFRADDLNFITPARPAELGPDAQGVSIFFTYTPAEYEAMGRD